MHTYVYRLSKRDFAVTRIQIYTFLPLVDLRNALRIIGALVIRNIIL